MKQEEGWWFPDGERHLPEWMRHPKNQMKLNGRPAYQGKKQLELIAQAGVARGGGPLRTFVDVGGHVGLWSFNFAKAFANVIAFEPVRAHRECFLRNLWPSLYFDDDIDLDAPISAENVNLEPYALGATPGRVAIRTGPESSGDSWVAGEGDIERRTLDSFALYAVDAIKIDCEGYEEFVLRGAEKTIKTWLPAICVEQKRNMASERFGLEALGAVKLLQSWGYKVVKEISGDYIMAPA